MTKLYNADRFNYNDIAWYGDYQSREAVADAVNNNRDQFKYSAEFMAASYAFEAQEDSDFEHNPDDWAAHLEFLEEDGAEFDAYTALSQCWIFLRREKQNEIDELQDEIDKIDEELKKRAAEIIEEEN